MHLVRIESTSIIAEVPEVNKLTLVSRQCDATRDKNGFQGIYYVHKRGSCGSPGPSSPRNFPVMGHPTFKLVRTWKRERHMTGIPETRVQLFQSAKDDQELTWRVVRPEAVIHSEVCNSSDLPQWILCDRFDALVIQSNYVQAQNAKLSEQKLLIPELVNKAAEKDSKIAHLELDLSMTQAEIQSLLNKTHQSHDNNLALMEKIADLEVFIEDMRSKELNLTEYAIPYATKSRETGLDQKYEEMLALLDIPKQKFMESEPDDLVNEWKENHKETKTNNNWLWCIGIAIGTALVLSFLFFVYHSYQKQRWEVLRLRHLVFASKDKAISVMTETPREMKNKMIAPVMDGNKIKKQQKLWNPEPFNELICNSAGVQGALIDDIVDNMETEGGDNMQNQESFRSINEGMAETHNV